MMKNNDARTLERSGLKVGIGPIAAMLIVIAVIVPIKVSAHNIDLNKAWEVARDYARGVRKDSGGGYLHYTTNCVNAFPGHNHIVRCAVTFSNAKDKKAGTYTCNEMIEVYFWPHGRSNTHNYTYNVRHTSGNKCGARQPGVQYV